MNSRRSALCLPLPAGERVGERANSALRRSALLVAFLAAPALAIDVQYQVAVRTDVRARTPLPGDVNPNAPTGDLELGPLGEVTLGGDTSTFSLQYAPTLIWREPQTGGRLLPLHRGRVTFANRWQRATLLVTEDAAYGVADIGSLRAADGAPLGGVNEVQTIGSVPYVRSATLLSLDTRPSDLLTLGFSAGFAVSGSIELSDTLPLQYGPSGAVRARVSVSRTDGLTTLAGVTSAQFVTGAEQLVAAISETWDHQVSRTVALTVGAGAAFTRELVVARAVPTSFDPTPGLYADVLPVVATTLGWRDVLSGHPLRLDASLRMAPFSDRFTANVYERLEGRLAGEWLPERRWTVTAAAGAAVALPIGASLVAPARNTAQAGDQVISGEANVAWTPETWLLLQASARVLWTAQPSVGNPGAVQAVGTVSVTVLQRDSLAW